MREKLILNVTRETSLSIVEVFLRLLREDEFPDALEEVECRVKAALEVYEFKRDRPDLNIVPSVN